MNDKPRTKDCDFCGRRKPVVFTTTPDGTEQFCGTCWDMPFPNAPRQIAAKRGHTVNDTRTKRHP